MSATTVRVFLLLPALLLSFPDIGSAQTRTLRIVTYNIEADTGGYTGPRPGLVAPSGGTVQQGGVLEGIGEEILGGDAAQALDILALQETTSNTSTLVPIVSGLNAFYNAPGRYAMSSYQARSSGGVSSGGGPSGLIYNTNTVRLLASVPVDPPSGSLGSSSGEYREVVRYEFAPAGVAATPANEFYVYVSHYKASTGSANEAARAAEAAIIRNDETSLPADARVLYVGDYNVTSSSEAGYQTIVAAAAPNGIAQGQGIDPMNPSGATGLDWELNSFMNQKTESATNLRYRDDLQIMTGNIYNGVPGGLALVPGTYHVFGNNGTTAYQGNVSSGSALTNLQANPPVSASALYTDLTTASDHLPVVADYTIPVAPPPPVAGFKATPTSGAATLSVTFSDLSTGSITNLLWTFGDGQTTNSPAGGVVTHDYPAGTYTITLVAQGADGAGTNVAPGYITAWTPFQAWQVQYFGSTTNPAAAPGADADGTGQDNQFKFVAGLNPTNASSVFVWSIAPTADSPWNNLTYGPVAPGRSYTPEFSTNLLTSVWLPLTTCAPPGTNGSSVSLTDTNPAAAQEFYRLLISWP